MAMPFSSNIEDDTEIEAASSKGYNSGGLLWTVPGLPFEKRQLILALSQPLISN